VDEERGSLGARAANAHPRARECRHLIVGEPTDNKLAVGCKGSLRVALLTRGSGGHSAYPDHGTSAIHDLLDLLADIRSGTWPHDSFFGETTVNIGIVGGGTGTNVLAPEARAELHFRLVGDDAAVRSELERIVNGRAEIEYLSVTPAVRLAAAAGFEQCVVGFTTDAAHLGNWGGAGGGAFLLGPGSILQAHTAHERISKRELLDGVDRYVRLVSSLIGVPAARAAS
jgi:acetylornithine deacetylase